MLDFFIYDLLYQPLYNALIFFYWVSGFIIEQKDMGLAVIFLTIFMRIVLLPFSIRSARTENRLERLQPALDKIKERYRYDIQEQRAAIKTVLQQNKVGVVSNFMSLVLQVLVFVVLYKIFSSGLQPTIGHNYVYTWNVDPGVIHSDFLGWLNLITPNQFASLFAAGVVFLSQAGRRTRFQEASGIEKTLLLGLPILTYLATIILPSAKALFIATTVIFGIWIRFIRWMTTRYLIKNDVLKEQIDDLWTN